MPITSGTIAGYKINSHGICVPESGMLHPVVAFDLETTGIDPADNQIIEIFARRLHMNKYLEVVDYSDFHTLVKLTQERDDFNRKLVPITDEELMEKGVPEEVAINDFVRFVGMHSTVVAQYAPFDLGFLNIRAKKYHPMWNLIFRRFYDTRTMSKLVEPTESASLSKVCARHGIIRKEEHRGKADVVDTIKVFQMQMPKLHTMGISALNLAANFDDRPIDPRFVAAYEGVARIIDLTQ